MNIIDLAKELDLFYEFGKSRKECNALVQCFGIRYANVIKEQGIKPEDIIEKSSLRGTKYATELCKGMKLSKYVCLNKNFML